MDIYHWLRARVKGWEDMEQIDIIITWVDNSDEKWRKEKQIWEHKTGRKEANNRYREWGFLPYLFRSIEKYAGWVNKVYFVTCGHIPDFLNTNYTKLQLISHEDFIPAQYLPTFNSNTIEMWLGFIPGLSETFVYMNDDMYFMSPMKPDDFFVDGLPVDSPIETALMYDNYVDPFGKIRLNDISAINSCYNKRKVIKKNWRKWYRLSYRRGLLNNLCLLPFHQFSDFKLWHNPQAYQKETWKQVHQALSHEVHITSNTKFRTETDMCQYVFRYWQLVTGNFYPKYRRGGYEKEITEKQIEEIKKIFHDRSCKMICLNDIDEECDFGELQIKLLSEFEKKFPEKSAFEK